MNNTFIEIFQTVRNNGPLPLLKQHTWGFVESHHSFHFYFMWERKFSSGDQLLANSLPASWSPGDYHQPGKLLPAEIVASPAIILEENSGRACACVLISLALGTPKGVDWNERWNDCTALCAKSRRSESDFKSGFILKIDPFAREMSTEERASNSAARAADK